MGNTKKKVKFKLEITDKDRKKIPESILNVLECYVNYHESFLGSYLYDLLVGDLYASYSQLGIFNKKDYLNIVEFIVAKFPPNAYGSEEKVEKWLKT